VLCACVLVTLKLVPSAPITDGWASGWRVPLIIVIACAPSVRRSSVFPSRTAVALLKAES